jgi:glycosyltransferase involved in cell wall biosynthesis
MKKPTDIIYVGNPFQADNRTSSHHIARQLSSDFRVFYLEAGGLRAPRANASDLGRIVRKLLTLFKPVQELEPNIFVKSIFAIPLGRFSYIRKLNYLIQKRALSNLYKKYGIVRPIIWNVSPAMIETLRDSDRSLMVYYCVDDFSSFPDVDVELVTKLDAEATECSDIIFTPSMPLFKKKSMVHSQCVLSPHGVDIDHFSKAQNHYDMPEFLPGRDKKIAGFWGLIEDWIDLELVKQCALALPDINFVMIGRVAVDIEPLDLPGNIIFVGQVKYEELPKYASFFDVMMIPYKLNDQVFNANPLKLREYLASGKPIVSVSNPEIEKYAHVVAIAKSNEEFVDLLQAELNDGDHSAEQRIGAISQESWRARYQEVIQNVVSLIEKKDNGS